MLDPTPIQPLKNIVDQPKMKEIKMGCTTKYVGLSSISLSFIQFCSAISEKRDGQVQRRERRKRRNRTCIKTISLQTSFGRLNYFNSMLS